MCSSQSSRLLNKLLIPLLCAIFIFFTIGMILLVIYDK